MHLPDTSAADTPSAPNARDSFLRHKSRLTESIRDSAAAWAEANQNLTVDELQKFSKTWAKRATRVASSGRHLREPYQYKSEFGLPIHVNSTLLETVNFGSHFLNEWSSQKGLKWECRTLKTE